MPSSFASRAYFAESARTTRPNSSALPPTGSVAVCSRLSRVAASAIALAISAFRNAMMSVGVPAGTAIGHVLQFDARRLGEPLRQNVLIGADARGGKAHAWPRLRG